MTVAVLALGASLVYLLASEDSDASRSFTAVAVSGCLEAAGLDVAPGPTALAPAPEPGARARGFSVEWEDNRALVLAEQSPDRAERRLRRLLATTSVEGRFITRYRNLIVEWSKNPEIGENEQMEECVDL
ncbi:MAG: hypothetical protein ACR2NA_04290 [Solirubrobacterales bacterium]